HVAPSSYERAHDWDGRISTVRIRVWADDAYRAQNIHWQQTFEDQLEHANEVLGGMFGVRLVAELRSWSRAAPDATLEDSLGALAELDPGDDVLTVVGLTSSLGIVAATFEKLGVARVGGRHMVLRGYADLEERKMFDRFFTELRSDERDLIYQSRRRHKTTGVLLHELGHNLGVEHVADEDTLMHAAYSEHTAKFDPHSRERILASFDRWLRRGQAAAVDPAPAAPGPAKAQARLVIDVDHTGKVSTNGNTLDDAQLDALFAAVDKSTDVTIRYGKDTPPEARNAIIGRAQAAGCRVSFVRY
ncbi:MAG TPA: matrixin family metalloprotease, partial [Kofleriaceae bacterium]|nr:matrixin family metalloprotease [Kofleriaceae bacterium]